MDYPVSFRVGAGPYRHRPIIKSCLGNSLFIIPPGKRVEEISAFRWTPFYQYRLVSFEHKNFHCLWVDFEISLDATGQWNSTIVCGHIQQDVGCLPYRFVQSIHNWRLAMNGLQVVHLINSFVLKDEVCCPNPLRIRKDVHFISMSNSFAGSINQSDNKIERKETKNQRITMSP